MEALLKAIKIKWDSNAAAELRALCKGGLWGLEAVRKGTNNDRTGIAEGTNNVLDNYIVLSFPGDISDKSMSSVIENVTADFNIFVSDEEGLQAIVQIRDEFKAVFDDVVLPMDKDGAGNTQRMVSMTRQTVGTPQKDPDEGYFLPITYEIMFG